MKPTRTRAVEKLHAATAIYTREPIARELLEGLAWPRSGGCLVDTSCGDGAFIVAALSRLLAFGQVDDRDLAAHLSGWEIHPGAAEQARERVARLLVDTGRAPKRAAGIAARVVRCGDFITEGPRRASFDAVVGNPPYLRFLNVPEPLRGEYRGIVPPHARADLLHSFIDRSARLLGERGELAMVTADRWLFNEGAAQLREIVGERFGLARLRRLDPSSSFYRPKQRRAGHPPRIHPVALVMRGSGAGVQAIGRPPIFPGHDGRCASFTDGPKLADVAEIRLAPWLGTPGVFLISADVAARIPIASLVPAVDTDDVIEGTLRTPTRYAIRTSPGVQPPAAVLSHIDRELHRMCPRGRRRGDNRWLPPETFHRLDLSQPSLLVPRIAKSIRPVRVPAGVLPVNHNLSIVRAGSMTLEEIEAVLSAPAAIRWARRFAAPLENGYVSITTRLLRQLPIGQA